MLPALVLTAGVGTRLDPLTRLVAKGAVPVGDSTLVERVLSWLERGGVREVVLNLHHRAETITGAVGDGSHLGLRVRYSWEDPILGSAGGPRHARSLIDADTWLIVNGDTLTDLPLAALLAAHEASGADVTMAVIPNPAPDHYNGVLADEHGAVTGFIPMGHAEASWHFVGVQVVRVQVFDGLADGVPAETVAGVYRSIVAASPGRIRIWQTDAAFHDVGTPADYLAATLAMSGAGPDASVVAPTALVAGSARLARSVVWATAQIREDVALDGCVVAGAAVVPPGLRATAQVIVPVTLTTADDRCERQGGIALFPLH